jgi:hypothetical protein
MLLIDLNRLNVYEKILSIPCDLSIEDNMGNHRTQRSKPPDTLVSDLKSKFLRHLMYRQLDRDGDL